MQNEMTTSQAWNTKEKLEAARLLIQFDLERKCHLSQDKVITRTEYMDAKAIGVKQTREIDEQLRALQKFL